MRNSSILFVFKQLYAFIAKEGRAGPVPGPLHMIKVTRLNGKAFMLNALYIETIESFPDTTITLTTGTKYVVLDPIDEVNRRIIEFYQSVQLLANPHIRGEEDEK